MSSDAWTALWEPLSRSDRETLTVLQRVPEGELPDAWQRPGHWQRVVDRLSPGAAALVQRIRRAGGSMPAGFVEAIAGPLRSNLDALSPRAYLTIHTPLSPLEEAFVHGLVWPGVKRDNQRIWIVPQAIAAVLAAVPPLFDAPPPVVAQPAAALDLDGALVAVVTQIRAGGVQMVRGGRAPQRLVAAAAPFGATPLMVQWIVALGLAGHAIQLGVHGLQPGPVLDEWLRMAPHLRRQELLRAWLTAAWNDWELTTQPHVRSIDMRTARRCVTYALLPHLPETWITRDACIQQIRLRWPDVVRPVSLQHRWQRPADWPTDWQNQDGVVLDMLLRGPVAWLGLVEWDETQSHLRRTSIGTWISGLTHIEEPKRTPSVSFEADFSCVLHDQTDIWARYQLSGFATQRDAHTWQIEPQSVQRAVAAGVSLSMLIPLIETLTGHAVDVSTRQQLSAWAGMVAVVRIAHAVVIQTPDAATLADVLHDRRLGLQDAEQLNETTLRIHPAAVNKAVHALQHAGYAIHVEGAAQPHLRETELVLLERALRAYRDTAATRALAAKLRAMREQEQHDG